MLLPRCRRPPSHSLASLAGCAFQKTIELHSFETKIGYAAYPTTDIRSVVPLLTNALGSAVTSMGGPRKAPDQSVQDAGEAQRAEAEKVPKEDMNGEIRHTWLWPRVGKFFKEHGEFFRPRCSSVTGCSTNGADLILAETGTSAFGIVNVPFPSNASCVVQTLWGESLRLVLVFSLTCFAGSIGWATGAALGVAVRPQPISSALCALR